MPAALPVLAYYGASAAGATAFWATVISVAVSYGVNDYQQRKAARDQKDAFNASQEDRLVMSSSTNQRRSRIYGRTRNVDGIIFKGTYGPKSEFYALVIALAGHECEEIGDVFADDQKVALEAQSDGSFLVATAPYQQSPLRSTRMTQSVVLDATGMGAITLSYDPVPGSFAGTFNFPGPSGTQGPSFSLIVLSVIGRDVSFRVVGSRPSNVGFADVFYQVKVETSYARVWKYRGTATQNVGADLLRSRFPGMINTPGNNDKFAGIALLVVELTFNEDAFPSGVPQFSADIKGVNTIYDSRTDTYGFSENPALCARDWARYKYGGDCNASDVDDVLIAAAANACDTPTVFSTIDGPQTRPLYQCGTVCPLEGDPSPSMDSLVEAMAGKWGWAGGKMVMVAGVYRAPVVEITEDWLSGASDIEIIPAPPRTQMVNIYRATIANADADPATPYTILEQFGGDNSLSQQEKPVVSAAWRELQFEQADILAIATTAGLLTERDAYDASLAALSAYLNGLSVPFSLANLAGPTTVVSATFSGKFSNVYDSRQVILNATNSSRPLKNLQTLSQEYVYMPVPGIRSQAYIDADGQELPREVKMAAITHVVHAQHVLGVLMRDAREALSIKLPCNLRALKLRLFDTVWLTLPTFGFDMKEFEVVSWSFSMTGGVVVIFKETTAAIFDIDDNFDTLDLAPNSTLPLPWYVPYIESITVSSGTEALADGTAQTRTLVTWAVPASASVQDGGIVEVQYVNSADILNADGPVDESVWQTVQVAGSTDRVVISGLLAGTPYLFRLRAVNATRVKGPWSLQRVHIISTPTDTTAEAAQDAADAALAALADIASDNVLTAGEKPQVIIDVEVILAEQAGIDAKAVAQNIVTETVAYDNAVVELEAYLATLTAPTAWDNLSGNTTIVGVTFRAKFTDLYAKRQTLLNLIAVKIADGAVNTNHMAENAATETYRLTSARAFPHVCSVATVVDAITITPTADCTAEVTAVFEGAATGSPGGDWGGSKFGTIAIPIGDVSTTFDPPFETLVASNVGDIDLLSGASSVRAMYTARGVFDLVAGVTYRCGMYASGASPDFGIHFTATVFAPPRIYVTIIKR